ncbi:MAG: Prokaryotic lipoprotein-attachment site [Pseudomonadota bacterium]|jgi:predicted small lipoprotein YifL
MVRGRSRVVLRRAGPRPGLLLAAILAASLLAACGQRGPLYLPVPPAEPPPRVRTPSSGTVVLPPAPVAPKDERRRDERPGTRAD